MTHTLSRQLADASYWPGFWPHTDTQNLISDRLHCLAGISKHQEMCEAHSALGYLELPCYTKPNIDSHSHEGNDPTL